MVSCKTGTHWRHQLQTNIGPCSPCGPDINLTIVRENPRLITVQNHGLINIKVPRLVSRRISDGKLVLATTNDQEVELGLWMAIGVVDVNTLYAYHVELLSSFGDMEFPEALFVADEYYWLGADGLHTIDGSPPEGHEVVMWYAYDLTNLVFCYDVKEFGATNINLFTEDVVFSEFLTTARIPADTPVNMNASTPGYTLIQDEAHAYTEHNAYTPETFNQFYPVKLAAYLSGGTGMVSQDSIYRDNNDAAGHVRFSHDILPGVIITFRSTIASAVT